MAALDLLAVAEVANLGDVQTGRDSTELGKSHSCERATRKSPLGTHEQSLLRSR